MTLPQLAPGQRVVVAEFGETPPDAIERLISIEAMAAPDPASLGPRDVIVAVRSASVGWVDLLMTSGQYQHAPRPPYTPGLEYAGEVAWRGPEAEGVAVGDRVLVDGFLAGPRSLGAYQAWGGWASYAVAPQEAVIPIPGALSFDEACNLLGNYETAYHCLVARGRVQAGEWVLIHGASGATGLAAVQIAKILGARVIATGRSAEKLRLVSEQGADHVLRLAEEDGGIASLKDRVKALTGGRGVDVVYDGVGGDISVESLRCVAFGARFLVVGWASTPFVARGKGGRGAPNANQLPTNLIMMKGLDVLGCPAAISVVHDPSIRPARLAAILGWAREGRLSPHVSHRFPLAEIQAAMRAKWGGEVTGGCVVHPAAPLSGLVSTSIHRRSTIPPPRRPPGQGVAQLSVTWRMHSMSALRSVCLAQSSKNEAGLSGLGPVSVVMLPPRSKPWPALTRALRPASTWNVAPSSPPGTVPGPCQDTWAAVPSRSTPITHATTAGSGVTGV
jgi:NADPH2:quinone reductase